jgi:hypothetical protein
VPSLATVFCSIPVLTYSFIYAPQKYDKSMSAQITIIELSVLQLDNLRGQMGVITGWINQHLFPHGWIL